MSYGIQLLVSGAYACFSRPEMKVERVSYDVMTPSAARGILEAIHWKPAILWVVDAIHVLKPIRFHTVRRNEVGHKAPAAKIKSAMKRGDLDGLQLVVEEDRQQRATTLLSDVAYVIEAHFERTARADDGDTDGKHLDIFNRRAARGQCFHQPCLGTREFPARFELLPPDAPMIVPKPEDRSAELGFGSPRDLGFMLFDIDHARDRASLFFRASLVNGVMKVPHPASPEIRR